MKKLFTCGAGAALLGDRIKFWAWDDHGAQPGEHMIAVPEEAIVQEKEEEGYTVYEVDPTIYGVKVIGLYEEVDGSNEY